VNKPATISELFARPVLDQVPRLLSQVDRNPHSPTYGSCCRNFWHYRVEDISNSQLQELALTLALAYRYEHDENPYFQSPKLLRWIDAVVRYTIKLQRPSGSFDEVYRGQDSYAATSFVSFCISETLLQLRDVLSQKTISDCVPMLRRAADWILKTDERLAANQMSGAAAALHNVAVLSGDKAYAEGASRICRAIEEMQSSEGWFLEYGGADIGYGSLTQAYLALIHARTGDELCKRMALASAEFLSHFVHRDGTAGGEYGSRNTEYFIPPGFLLLWRESPACDRLARWLVAGLRDGRHAIIARCFDDRYFAYLSAFYMLAAQLAPRLPVQDYSQDTVESLLPPENVYFPDCKMWSLRTPALQFTANLAKGGVFRAQWNGSVFFDDGIFGVTTDRRLFTTQHLYREAKVTVEGSSATIQSGVFIHKPVTVTPWRNILVRGFNLSVPAGLRRRFLDFLRRTAVSSGKRVGSFVRKIVIRGDSIEVVDTITMDVTVERAVLQLDKERSFSFASTGFFQPQELTILPGEARPLALKPGAAVTIKRTLRPEGVVFEAAS
jgi:hypothetical protein